MRQFAAAFLLGLAGCSNLNLVPAKTFPEQVAYVEAGAQGAITTLAGFTCRAYTPLGRCTETARPLHPARSEGYLDTLSKVRRATRAAANISASGASVGDCLGQPATPIACLALATTMLGEVQKVLEDLK